MRRVKYVFNRGDFVSLREGVAVVNVYHDDHPFLFNNVLFVATEKDTGIILSHISDNNISLLYYYVRVLFTNGSVGVVALDNLKIIQSSKSINHF